MFELKSLNIASIDRSLDKAEHYRLLNEPGVAESICRDVLSVDGRNQRATIYLILAISDQFNLPSKAGIKQALELADGIDDEYQRLYFTGLVHERQANAKLAQNYPGCQFDAYDLLREAMERFEKAERLETKENDDAVLRWNRCARIIMEQKLEARQEDDFTPLLE